MGLFRGAIVIGISVLTSDALTGGIGVFIALLLPVSCETVAFVSRVVAGCFCPRVDTATMVPF